MTKKVLINLKDIVKIYNQNQGENEFEALKGINLDVHEGELLAIIGSSGSGKSTLMNIIGLLDKPTSGEYHLLDKNVTDYDDDELADMRNQTIGFIFQSFFLLPKQTAMQNVCLPLSYRQMNKREAEQKALAVLDKVGLKHLANNKPNQLSGGQQQRVAIARALVGSPSLLLADEPTGALDSHTSQEVLNLFIKLNREEHATVIIITHDPKVAEQCNRVIHITDGHITGEDTGMWAQDDNTE